MATTRGMNMRDMKGRSMSKTGALPPRPGSRPRGRPRKDSPAPPPPARDEVEGTEAELLDPVEEAVHVAQSDGHFAPQSRRYQKDEDERDCPSEPPPGWGEVE